MKRCIRAFLNSWLPNHPREEPLKPSATAVNLNLMPEPPDDYEPTEANIDMVVKEVTGEPVKPANLAPDLLSMRLRIVQCSCPRH